MNDDHALLQRYVREGEQEAFRTLVSRYAGLVYSAALRHVREPALAEEAAQNVFTLLAMKAKNVPREASLAGWLHQSACHLSRHLCRSEARRRVRESAAAELHSPEDTEPLPGWEDLGKVLDESLSSLKSDDREAVLLRFMRGLSLREVGGVLQTSEDGARMKINRALEKLRGLLARRGITSTAAALSGTLAAHAMSPVPADLTCRLTALALKTATQTTTTTQLALMSTKAKVIFLTAGAALTAVVGTPLVIHRERNLRAEISSLEDRIAGLAPSASSKYQPAGTASTPPGNSKVAAKSTAKPTAASDMAAQMAQAKALIGNGKGKAAIGAAFSGAMKLPGMKELMKSQTKPIVEKIYADLLDGLWQLSPEQRAKALDALIEPMSEAQVAAMEILQNGKTEENMKKMSAAAKVANEKRDAVLKEIVNDPVKFAQFTQYEESSAERMKLSQFRDALVAKDDALGLSEPQEEKLMNMMYRERKALNMDTPLEQRTTFDPSAFSDEAMQKQREKSQQLMDRIMSGAQPILKPEQLTVLKDSLQGSRAMEEASMDMAKVLFSPEPQGETKPDQ